MRVHTQLAKQPCGDSVGCSMLVVGLLLGPGLLSAIGSAVMVHDGHTVQFGGVHSFHFRVMAQ